MSTELEKQAFTAVYDADFEQEPRMCQRFVRQCIQAVHGSRFDEFHESTAAESLKSWRSSSFAVDPKRGSVPGDILYWRGTDSNPSGHVAIRVSGNRVAENSYVHEGNPQGSKGFRPLYKLRLPHLIVRLPD